jgi:hypothetical protein
VQTAERDADTRTVIEVSERRTGQYTVIHHVVIHLSDDCVSGLVWSAVM